MPDPADNANSGGPINVAAQQVAKIYAKALLGAAEKSGATASLMTEFDALVSEVLLKFPQLETVLGSALIKHEEKLGILDRTFGGRLSPTLLNFLKVLSGHGRLDLVRDIHREAHVLYDEMRGRTHVHIRSAAPLDKSVTQNMFKILQSKLGGQPELDTTVDPDLIGGVVVRVGDMVFDGSVVRQLEQVREQMIHRSVHEIQSRRDRFRHTGGD